MEREAEEKDRVGEREEWVAPSRLQSVLFLKFYKVTGTTCTRQSTPHPFPGPLIQGVEFKRSWSGMHLFGAFQVC